MLKTSTTGSPQLAQILSKANFVPEKKWPNSQSPSGTYSFMLLEWLSKCVALFVHRDLSIVCGTVTHSLCSFRLQEHHCCSYPTPLLFLFSSSFLKTCYQTGARRWAGKQRRRRIPKQLKVKGAMIITVAVKSSLASRNPSLFCTAHQCSQPILQP